VTGQFRPQVGVHLILIDHGRVLLGRRANTGFADGYWSLPGGCLDGGEPLTAGAAREAREELGIIVQPAAELRFVHLCHHLDGDGEGRIGVFFRVTGWDGQPVNAEPHKCSQIAWFPLDNLPANIVDYTSIALSHHQRNTIFSLCAWP
jgi:8-oxo-dGTP pyrophosphatase MutT (NUDIX family)